MEVKFTATGKDMQKFHRYMMRRNPSYLTQVFLNPIGIAALFLTSFSLASGGNVRLWWDVVVLELVFIGLFVWATDAGVPKQAAKLPATVCDHVITILPEGVTERTELNEGFHSWRAITKIEASNDYIYLFINPIQAHVIPARAFANLHEAVRFRDLAMQYWQQARNDAAIPSAAA